MKFALENSEIITNSYNSGKSAHEIAKILRTNPVRINRALKYLGVKIRSRKEATQNALKTGRLIHPTEGKTRTVEEKIKISEGQAKFWENLTDAERSDISNRAREQWDNLSDTKREEIRRKANDAIRLAAKEGSIIENHLHQELLAAGYMCLKHQKVLENDKLEVDLYLPAIRVAIEVDGPSHFYPIWGEDVLKRNMKADLEKNGLLLNRGYTVIRLRTTKKTLSNKIKRDVVNKILEVLKNTTLAKTNEVVFVEV